MAFKDTITNAVEWIRRTAADYLLNREAPAVRSPMVSRTHRWLDWAYTHASDNGRHRYQSQLNQFAIQTGKAYPMGALVDSHGRVLNAGIPQPERISSLYPAYAGLGFGRPSNIRSLPKATSFNLRRFSEQPPARRAIDKIKNSITRLEWKVSPLDEKFVKRPGKNVADIPFDMQGRMAAAERIFRAPNRDQGWKRFIGEVVEDILVGGFGAIELAPWEGNRLIPLRMWSLDGMSVRVNPGWITDDDQDPELRYRYTQALIFGAAGAASSSALKKFHDKDLVYLKYDSRTSTPFGLGPLEVAYQMINAWLGQMEARERKESNDIPEFALDLGQDVSKEEVEAFRYYWENYIEGYGKIPIIGGGQSPQAIMFRMRQMGTALNAWPELILRMVAISFGLSPMTMGIEADVNRSTAETTQSEGFADSVLPTAYVIEDYFTNHILHKVLGWDDLKFEFVVTQGDRRTEVEIARLLSESDLATVNEAREHAGLDPWPDDDPRGDMTMTEYREMIRTKYMLQQQQAAAAMQQQMGGMPPGMDPNDPNARLAMEEQATLPLRDADAFDRALLRLGGTDVEPGSIPLADGAMFNRKLQETLAESVLRQSPTPPGSSATPPPALLSGPPSPVRAEAALDQKLRKFAVYARGKLAASGGDVAYVDLAVDDPEVAALLKREIDAASGLQ